MLMRRGIDLLEVNDGLSIIELTGWCFCHGMNREKKGLQLPIFIAKIIRKWQIVNPLFKEVMIMRLIEPACHSSYEAG